MKKLGRPRRIGPSRRELERMHCRHHHGNSVPSKRLEGYLCWRAMKQRCRDPKFKGWKYYGGRGIKVCDRWADSFAAFLDDMGPRPSRLHSIDRFPDNDGNYEPGNCRWATAREQQRNMRSTVVFTKGGVTKTAYEWSEELGIRVQTILHRKRRGRTDEECLFPCRWTTKDKHGKRVIVVNRAVPDFRRYAEKTESGAWAVAEFNAP